VLKIMIGLICKCLAEHILEAMFIIGVMPGFGDPSPGEEKIIMAK
jgi:hypothetical protein